MNMRMILGLLLLPLVASGVETSSMLVARDFSWTPQGKVVVVSGDCVRAAVDAGTVSNRTALYRGTLPAARLGGAQLLEGRIRARAKAVAKPEVDYLGIKFQVSLRDTFTGHTFHPNVAAPRFGTFDWRELTVGVPLAGLDLPERITLELGLQGTTGEIEFDLSSLRFEIRKDVFPVTNTSLKAVYTERVTSLPALRGVMLSGGRDLTEEDFAELQRWGAKLGRFQMVRQWGVKRANRDLVDYDRWIEGRLARLRQALVWAQKYGIRIVIDVHSAPGGRNDAKEMCLFFEKEYRDYFIRLWQKIAARFKGHPALYGYDLVNEPIQKTRAPFDYWTIQRDAAAAIRAIDPETPIIVESNDMASPVTFGYLSPMPFTNVIYQCHMYIPSAYTHQGVFGGRKDLSYPDASRGWDCDYLRRTLSRVRDFQRRHGARIYVGEFSAVAWADGADRYLADCISLFEEYGWDWSYHCFREWPGWSVEHAGKDFGDLKRVGDTPRKRVLIKGLR